ELCQRDRRVNIVEGDNAARMPLHIFTHLNAIRNIGTDNDCIGIGDMPSPAGESLDRMIIAQFAKVRVAQIPIVGIPGKIALQEQNVVSTRRKGGKERAIGGGMTISPGGGEAQSKDDQFHAASFSRASADRITPSTSSPLNR